MAVSLVTLVLFAAYFINAGLALVIVKLSRKGPDYHPALNNCALAGGLPGAYAALAFALPLVGPPQPPRFWLISGYALTFILCCCLQVTALRLVIVGNRVYAQTQRIRAARRRAGGIW